MSLLVKLAAFAAFLSGAAVGQDVPRYGNGSSTPPPTVDLGYVKYTGATNTTSGITTYKGIRYAQNPTGDLRWRAPQPIEANNDYNGRTLDASAKGPVCWQSNPYSLFGTGAEGFYQMGISMPQSEDCLLLDVLVPINPVSKSLPVMLQIHGGGYTTGGTGFYAGDALVNRSDGQMIYVDIQYRLGLFGFLAGESVREDGVANAGLLDQRAALEWVQRNIRAFGGDPARVTIWGGSAGGGSVTLQLTAYGGSGSPPFSAAIAEYPWWQPLLNKTSQEIQYRNALEVSNCTSLSCLRALPIDQLSVAAQATQNYSYINAAPGAAYGSYYFGPTVDGVFVRELPSESFALSQYYKVPLIVDRDAYEGVLFSNETQTEVVDETADAQRLFPLAGPSFFSRMYQYYPRDAYNSTFYQRQSWFGDFIINCPTYYMASNAVDTYKNNSQVWKLVFAAGSELHSATAAFLASNTTTLSGNNGTLIDYMTAWWISFTVHHDPNVAASSGAPNWPSYVSGGNDSYGTAFSVGFNTLQVNYNSIETLQDPDATPHCDFFGSNQYVVRN